MILDGELLDLLEKLAVKAGVSPSERLDEIIKDEYYRINRIVPQELSTDPYWRDHRDVEHFDFCGNTIYRAYNMLSRHHMDYLCLLYTSPSPRDATLSRMPSSA